MREVSDRQVNNRSHRSPERPRESGVFFAFVAQKVLDLQASGLYSSFMSEHETRLSEILNDAMKAQGVSIRDLALATGVTYEHIRRVVRGMSNPATPLLKLLCGFLDLDEGVVLKYAAADDLERRYGDVPALISGKNPELSMLERYWTDLTDDQKNDLTNLARDWAKRNKENT